MSKKSRITGVKKQVNVQIECLKLNPGAHPPERMSRGASGFDLRACLEADIIIEPGRIGLVPTGLAMAIPGGYEGQVRPRSGMALKHGVTVANTPGTIDSDYRGEIRVILINLGSEPFSVSPGDRIAQLVITPVVEASLEFVQRLEPTPRGDGGFGHTGTS
jgi:dUTP pyrophosphatase